MSVLNIVRAAREIARVRKEKQPARPRRRQVRPILRRRKRARDSRA